MRNCERVGLSRCVKLNRARSWRCVAVALRIGWLVRLATAALISGSALLLAGAPAEARHYRHYAYHPYHRPVARAAHYPRYAHRGRVHAVRRATAAVSGSPAFSAIVVDANSGRTLYSADENGLRHPASITKVMTLYLLFEQLDRGAMTLRTRDSDLRARRRAGALEARRSGPATRSASRTRSRRS